MALTDGLISFWELEEATGTGDREDAHGSNDLTPSASLTGAAGLVGDAAKFSGSNRLSIATNETLEFSDEDFTITGWMYLPAGLASGTSGEIASKFNNSSFEGEFRLNYDRFYGDGNESINFQWKPLTGITTITHTPTGGTYSKGAWYFLAARHDSTNDLIRLRIGTTDVTAVSTGGNYPATHTGDFKLGNTNCPDLMQDQWGLWRRHLSDAELDTLYNGGAGLSYAALAGGSPEEHFGDADLSAAATLSATGYREALGAAAVSAAATVAAAGLADAQGAATLDATASLTGAGLREALGTADVSATASLSAAAIAETFGVVAMTATGQLTATGFATLFGAAALAASATLTGAPLDDGRNWLWIVGSPQPKWTAGEPSHAWAAGAPVAKWTAGAPRP